MSSDRSCVRARRSSAIALAFVLFAVVGSACRSVPEGKTGPEAEALADRMLQAINHDAWVNGTAAISFSFQGDRSHLWDRRRNLVRTAWKDKVVLFDTSGRRVLARQAGQVVTDPKEIRELYAAANKAFVNDAFWFNPLLHIRSPGAERSLVSPRILKVHYPSGGVTPGDSYVFFTDEQALVTTMRLWVSILPFKGTSADFQEYAAAETGFKSARFYVFLKNIRIKDVKAYAEYPPKDGTDAFAELLAR